MSRRLQPSVMLMMVLVLQGVVLVVRSATDDANQQDGDRQASACYGTYQSFLGVYCPSGQHVQVVSMMNGAKPKAAGCPDVMTPSTSQFHAACCSHASGDCVVKMHANNLPVECSGVEFCKPQARRANTNPECNDMVFPEVTHYTTITYRCVPASLMTPIPAQPTSTKTPNTTLKTDPVIDSANKTSSPNTSTDTPESKTPVGGSIPITISSSSSSSPAPINTPHGTDKIKAEAVTPGDDTDDFTPAMIGGMVAGVIGLMLTILIFIFYWGRKKQIRISGTSKAQSSVWDFLLANTMSVRAFRGYDNFTSASRHAGDVSSEDGASASASASTSPVTRKTVWLPNISLDSGHGGGESVITSDDNCSVATVEHCHVVVNVPGCGNGGGGGRGRGGGGGSVSRAGGRRSRARSLGAIRVGGSGGGGGSRAGPVASPSPRREVGATAADVEYVNRL